MCARRSLLPLSLSRSHRTHRRCWRRACATAGPGCGRWPPCVLGWCRTALPRRWPALAGCGLAPLLRARHARMAGAGPHRGCGCIAWSTWRSPCPLFHLPRLALVLEPCHRVESMAGHSDDGMFPCPALPFPVRRSPSPSHSRAHGLALPLAIEAAPS
jgi:hypothetical protein